MVKFKGLGAGFKALFRYSITLLFNILCGFHSDSKCIDYLDDHRWIILLIIAEALAELIHKPLNKLIAFVAIWILLNLFRRHSHD